MQYKEGQYVMWHESEVLILEVFQYSKKALIQDTIPNDFGEYDSRLVLLNELGEETYDVDEELDISDLEPEAMIDVIAKKMNSVMPSEYWCLAVLGIGTLLGIIRHFILMIM